MGIFSTPNPVKKQSQKCLKKIVVVFPFLDLDVTERAGDVLGELSEGLDLAPHWGGGLHEGVLEDGLGGGALGGDGVEESLDEVDGCCVEEGREVGEGHIGVRSPGLNLLSAVWETPGQHCVQHDTTCPHVRCKEVKTNLLRLLALNEGLGCQVLSSAGSDGDVLVVAGAGESEVAELADAVGADHDVLGLDVAVDDTAGVEVADTLDQLREACAGLGVVEFVAVHDLLEERALAELHDDVGVVLCLHLPLQLHNVLAALRFVEGTELVVEVVKHLLLLVVRVAADLHCNPLACLRVHCKVHSAERPASELASDKVLPYLLHGLGLGGRGVGLKAHCVLGRFGGSGESAGEKRGKVVVWLF